MADEMGLGKTVCSILFNVVRPTLTVLVAMHCPDVDLVKTVARSWEINDSEMCHCLSIKSGSELGK